MKKKLIKDIIQIKIRKEIQKMNFLKIMKKMMMKISRQKILMNKMSKWKVKFKENNKSLSFNMIHLMMKIKKFLKNFKFLYNKVLVK